MFYYSKGGGKPNMGECLAVSQWQNYGIIEEHVSVTVILSTYRALINRPPAGTDSDGNAVPIRQQKKVDVPVRAKTNAISAVGTSGQFRARGAVPVGKIFIPRTARCLDPLSAPDYTRGHNQDTYSGLCLAIGFNLKRTENIIKIPSPSLDYIFTEVDSRQK